MRNRTIAFQIPFGNRFFSLNHFIMHNRPLCMSDLRKLMKFSYNPNMDSLFLDLFQEFQLYNEPVPKSLNFKNSSDISIFKRNAMG